MPVACALAQSAAHSTLMPQLGERPDKTRELPLIRGDGQLSDEELKLALVLGRVGTWRIDVTRGLLVSSDTCKANYGRTPADPFSYDELAGSVVESDRVCWRDTVAEALSTGSPFEMEYGCSWPDGSVHAVLVRGICLTDSDGRVVTMLGISVDVTEQHVAREDLRDVQARLEATLAAGNVATWTWDVTEDRVVADRNLARFFGVSEADARGGSLSAYVDAMHPDDREHITQLIQAALRNGGRFEAKYRVRDRDGIYRTIVARGLAEYSDSGKPVRLPGVVIDVTRQEELLATTRAAHAESVVQRRKLGQDVQSALGSIQSALETLKGSPAAANAECGVIEQQIQQIQLLLGANGAVRADDDL